MSIFLDVIAKVSAPDDEPPPAPEPEAAEPTRRP